MKCAHLSMSSTDTRLVQFQISPYRLSIPKEKQQIVMTKANSMTVSTSLPTTLELYNYFILFCTAVSIKVKDVESARSIYGLLILQDPHQLYGEFPAQGEPIGAGLTATLCPYARSISHKYVSFLCNILCNSCCFHFQLFYSFCYSKL